jgi:BON domain
MEAKELTGGASSDNAAIARGMQERPFRPYANITSSIQNEVYERLARAFSEMDPRERPWCGIGVDVGLLAVSPRDVTVADIREVKGLQQGVVRVSRNWREPWHVETVDGARHVLQGNPCEQAESAASSIKQSLDSLDSASDRPPFPSIKYLVIFPDEYQFEGPKEFSILDQDRVLKLTLRNVRDLPELILQTSRHEKLDSRKYRKWIKSAILRKNDDSITGTWLDPAFEEVATEPSKTPLWRSRHLPHEDALVEEGELSLSEISRTKSIQTKSNRNRSKLILTVITGLLIGTVGWRLYHARKAVPSTSHSRPSPPPTDNTMNVAQAIQAAMPQENPSLPEGEERDIVPTAEVRTQREALEAQATEKNQFVESAKNHRDRNQDAQEPELKRQKMELQIDRAIRLRAITGVTVKFTDDRAYLKGQVNTESQKSAAEKAARSVRGVKEVRNSIEVNR